MRILPFGMKTLANFNSSRQWRSVLLGAGLLAATCIPSLTAWAQNKDKPAAKPAVVKPSVSTAKAVNYPQIGAQVWVEPGMTPEQISQYFKILADHKMPVARLFLVWNWMEVAEGKWDFALYDACFDAAAKYGVGIVATLMPNQPPTYQGPEAYFKVQDGAAAKTERIWQKQAAYIQAVVKHYAKHPALDTWMLMNEPGQLPSPDSMALDRFRVAMKAKYGTIEKLNQAWLAGYGTFESIQYSENWAGGGFTWPTAFTDWQHFWREHLSFYLERIAKEIRKTDVEHPLHVNPHALLDIQEKYDLPYWATFLSSLGSSVHPVWHFDMLKRRQYTHGISLVGDYVGEAAGEKPYWITELQGGLNAYTGSKAITPTATEIKHWLWTGVGTAAQRTIFWCLNPRLKGTEAGEWAMLDYQNNPSDRLLAAKEVAEVMAANPETWANVQAVRPEVYLVQSHETMVLQQRAKVTEGGNPARTARAHKNAVLGTYQALLGRGVSPQVVTPDQMNWQRKDLKPKVAIVPHAQSLTDQQLEAMRTYAENGGTLVLTGLVGMFNEAEQLRYTQNSTLNQLIGGKVKAVGTTKGVEGDEAFFLDVAPFTATRVGTYAGQPVWEHKLGRGRVVTVAAVAGLDAYHAFQANKSQTWDQELVGIIKAAGLVPSLLTKVHNPTVTIRHITAGGKQVAVLVNTSAQPQSISFEQMPATKLTALPTRVGETAKPLAPSTGEVSLAPNEVKLLQW